MSYSDLDPAELRRMLDKDDAIYNKIMTSGKYKGQHLLVVDGKIVVQESGAEAFWEKASKYDGVHALHIYVPTYVHPLHPLLGMYSK